MVKLYETSVEAIKTGDLQKWAEAQRLQLIGEPFRTQLCFLSTLGACSHFNDMLTIVL